MASTKGIFPPLFVWMVGHSGEDLAGGFQKAADLYQARASYRTETLLYSALPCAVLALGLMVVSQIEPVVAQMVSFLNAVGGTT
jgi:type II secretory pathway component PulF